MDTAKAPVKLVKVTRVLGRTGTRNPTAWRGEAGERIYGLGGEFLERITG
jgi:hypothetical protein